MAVDGGRYCGEAARVDGGAMRRGGAGVTGSREVPITTAQDSRRREAAGPPACRARKDRLCVAAMVLGVLAVIVPFAEVLLSVPAIVFAIAGLRRVRSRPELYGGKSMAIAGLALGLVGVAMCVPSTIILIQVI